MVISLPKGILALNLCTEKNLAIFCAEMVRSVTIFFTLKSENPFLPSLHIKSSVWIELMGICSDVLKSLTYSQSAIVIYVL